MKRLFALALLIVLGLAPCRALDNMTLDMFQRDLAYALKTKDEKKLGTLFYWQGTPDGLRAVTLTAFQQAWDAGAVAPLQVTPADNPDYPGLWYQKDTKNPVVYNDVTYGPNLKPERLCIIAFVKDGQVVAGFGAPIGTDPNGNVRLIGYTPLTK